MWGADHGVQNEATDSWLVNNIPRTIDDTVELTAKLDFRYLWVNRYCIDQTSAQVKHQQIQHLHTIYASAQTTLTAAAGDNSALGLPSVSPVRQSPCRTVMIGRLTFVSKLELEADFKSLARRSSWTSRAWTFQEISRNVVQLR